jgi:hypothetical protein
MKQLSLERASQKEKKQEVLHDENDIEPKNNKLEEFNSPGFPLTAFS